MECNRDEALRAKSIAEDKLEKKDFAGARKFALKAHALYPGLDGISQMLTTLDVYVAAENKVSGEVDWYGVLGVNPSADDETMKKQYRKFALMLHPDKNKSVGAEGAFKLISEAWSMLSDKTKRLAYNQRRGSKGLQQKVPMHAGGPSAAPPANGMFNYTSRTASGPKPPPPRKSSKLPPKPPRTPLYQRPAPTPTPPYPKPTRVPAPDNQGSETFWTICHRCKMHYEYLILYRNRTLLCPTCQVAFMASETAPPVNFSKSYVPKLQDLNFGGVPKPQDLNFGGVPKPQDLNFGGVPKPREVHSGGHVPSQNVYNPGSNVASAQKAGAGQTGQNSFKNANCQQCPLSGTPNSSGNADPSIAAKAANVVQQAQDKLKRSYTESHASVGWDGLKKRKIDDDGNRHGMNHNMAARGNGAFATAPRSRIYGFFGTYHQPNSTRELTSAETQKMLQAKARKAILKKLNEQGAERTPKVAKEKEMSLNKDDMRRYDQNGKISEQEEKPIDESEVYPAPMTMNVPDPDFHDFDLDRTESSFEDNEVWSAYDDDDGMPRFYALISKVISRRPFQLRISWLNSKTNSEFSTADWVGSGFYKTCGEFRVGRYVSCKSINSFSQRVHWSKGPRGSILIFPQKGDVWALYKNWSPDWNEHTPDEVVHKYDMVMVLDDYNEEQGALVAPLMKVDGFRTVFRPNLDLEAKKRIPKPEMFRFSHRVPHHLLTSQETQNALEGCLELDPAATPLELLQILESSAAPLVPDGENINEEVKQSVPSAGLDEISAGRKNLEP